MDEKEKRVNCLLDTIDQGLMNEQTIGKFTYYDLAVFLEITQNLINGKEIYWKIKSHLENITIQSLRKQDRIIVGFIANFSNTWIGDELFRLFEQTDKFEPYIFLIANYAPGQTQDQTIEEYTKNLAYFKSRNIGKRVVQTLDINTGVQYTWEQIGIKPQVCIWLTPWLGFFQGPYNLFNYSLDVIHTYIPYGIMIANNETGTFPYDQYNQILHNVTWKNFEESKYAVDMAEKYAFIGNKNAIYTGYPKMDEFYNKEIVELDIWDNLVRKSGNPDAKRIIYAPHHSFTSDELVNFSTFASNYLLFLELAEQFQDETIWVFKPHPGLKRKAINAGIFADNSEWDAYVQKWKSLKNAEIMEEGMYHNLFVKSDAMILDSVSFLAEYLYVHKPLLLLKRNGQYFNDFGKELIKVHYSAWGTDKQAIEGFILDVVLNGNDTRKEAREEFFSQHLDYVNEFGKSAAANIHKQICDGLA